MSEHSDSEQLQVLKESDQDFVPAGNVAYVLKDDEFAYDNCVEEIKNIIADCDFSGEIKASAINKVLLNHFEYINNIRNFDKAIGSFLSFLKLMKVFEKDSKIDPYHSDSSLVHLIFNTFYDFLEEQGSLFANEILEQQVFFPFWQNAIRIVSHFNSSYLKKIEYIFKLDSLDDEEEILKEILLVIRELIYSEKNDKAIQWIIYFKLHDHFFDDFIEIAFYCFNKNDRPLLEKYLEDHDELRDYLLIHLDNLVDFSEFSVESYQTLKIDYKPYELKYLTSDKSDTAKGRNAKLNTIIMSLVRKYDLHEELIPNTMMARAFRQIMYKHFEFYRGKTSEENYEDTYEQLAKNNFKVQKFILEFLCSVNTNDYKRALFWAYFFDISDDLWPKNLRLHAASHSKDVRIANEEVNKKLVLLETAIRHRFDDCFLRTEKGEFPIYMVDTRELLLAAVEDIMICDIIGIDVEYRTSCLSINDKAALLQIAAYTKSNQQNAIYLFDIISLENEMNQNDWEDFFTKIFCNDNIIKNGFSFKNDFRVLIQTFPWLKKYEEQISSSTICIELVNSQIIVNNKMYESVYPGYNIGEYVPRKLSDLSYLILGERLDKSEQQGNWCRRPLRLEQKIYAAKDAYYLIELYYEILNRLERGLRNPEEVKAVFDASKTTYSEKKKEANSTGTKAKREKPSDNVKTPPDEIMKDIFKRIRNELANDGDARVVKDVQLVVDNMVNNVGKELRKCGIYTTTTADRNVVIKHASQYKKTEIITMGKAYDQLAKIPGFSGRVHGLPFHGNQSLMQQVEFVLRKLKIKVYDEDYFSRCINCNATNFVIVPSPIIKYMYVRFVIKKNFDFLMKYTKEDLKATKRAVLNIDPNDYGGKLCDITYEKNANMALITAKCENGYIDITNALVIGQDSLIGPVKININVQWEQVIDKPNVLFYVCHKCGKAFYEDNDTKEKSNDDPKQKDKELSSSTGSYASSDEENADI